MKVFLQSFKLITYILCLCFLLPQLSIAQVQSYPNKPIRLIVPFPPGGVTDIMARAMATKMSESMNTQIVIDNKAGASGALGAEIAAKSPPDGYTWLMGNISSLGINPATMAKLGYDPVKSFDPAGMVAIQPLVITVNSQLPIKNLSELVQWAKVHPGELNLTQL
jgi:tripartite-type tricarboxylate transporter receptor subunit TctC